MPATLKWENCLSLSMCATVCTPDHLQAAGLYARLWRCVFQTNLIYVVILIKSAPVTMAVNFHLEEFFWGWRNDKANDLWAGSTCRAKSNPAPPIPLWGRGEASLANWRLYKEMSTVCDEMIYRFCMLNINTLTWQWDASQIRIYTIWSSSLPHKLLWIHFLSLWKNLAVPIRCYLWV